MPGGAAPGRRLPSPEFRVFDLESLGSRLEGALRTRGPRASVCTQSVLTRSAFVARKPNYDRPNWFGVGLAFSTTAALWVLLFKQHNEDVTEYERRQKERHHKCTGCS
ncbi:NADH dehydrogenase [ubiquinone] 1 subunit C1, mitochondrial isoform X1 [Apteryx rowi]|uniref:NADH dehydrogenase [ubiquinone] 1 subunit C1, mitochondrial isoform X1 n=1 Tax=Apteryx rowi TaxID=308060 RepID=UPI000E1DD9C5|nr:NADH dehydrogenase [ubiquinone] 1 subunit C1, mitochondrial isoform X1 [Apteryx rowi]